MLIRLSKSPVLNTKLSGVLNEWGEKDLDPVELFRCPDNCYDVSDISSLMSEVQGFDKELALLDENVDDSSLYENVERLRNNYHGCFDRLNTNLTELEKFQKEKTESDKKKREKKNKYARKKQKHGFADDHFSEYQRTRTREKDVFYDVKHELKSDAKYKPENIMPENSDVFNIQEYLDNNISVNAEFTNRIKSTLSNLGKSLISENIDAINLL